MGNRECEAGNGAGRRFEPGGQWWGCVLKGVCAPTAEPMLPSAVAAPRLAVSLLQCPGQDHSSSPGSKSHPHPHRHAALSSFSEWLVKALLKNKLAHGSSEKEREHSY